MIILRDVRLLFVAVAVFLCAMFSPACHIFYLFLFLSRMTIHLYESRQMARAIFVQFHVHEIYIEFYAAVSTAPRLCVVRCVLVSLNVFHVNDDR